MRLAQINSLSLAHNIFVPSSSQSYVPLGHHQTVGGAGIQLPHQYGLESIDRTFNVQSTSYCTGASYFLSLEGVTKSNADTLSLLIC